MGLESQRRACVSRKCALCAHARALATRHKAREHDWSDQSLGATQEYGVPTRRSLVPKLYRFFVRALLFSILLPAVALAEFFGRTAGSRTARERAFMPCVLVWCALLSAPFVTLFAVLPTSGNGTQAGRVYLLAAVLLFGLLLLASLCSMARAGSFSAPPQEQWASAVVRPTLPNLMAIAAILFEGVQIAAVALTVVAHDPDVLSEPVLGHFVSIAKKLSFADLSPGASLAIGGGLAGTWLLACALPLVMDLADGASEQRHGRRRGSSASRRDGASESGGGELRSRPFYHQLELLLGRAGFNSIVLLLAWPAWSILGGTDSQIDECRRGVSAAALALLSTFILTTQMLMPVFCTVAVSKVDTRLDIVSPPLFTCGAQLLQLVVLLAAPFGKWDARVALCTMAVAALLQTMWSLSYPALFGVSITSSPICSGLKLVVSTLELLVVSFTCVRQLGVVNAQQLGLALSWGSLAILSGGIVVIGVIQCHASRSLRAQLLSSGLLEAERALAILETTSPHLTAAQGSAVGRHSREVAGVGGATEAVVSPESPESRRHVSTAPQLAARLLRFEDGLGLERLDSSFLATRSHWRKGLRDVTSPVAFDEVRTRPKLTFLASPWLPNSGNMLASLPLFQRTIATVTPLRLPLNTKTSPVAGGRQVMARASELKVHLVRPPTYAHLLEAFSHSQLGDRLPNELAERIVTLSVPECMIAQILMEPSLQCIVNSTSAAHPRTGFLGTLSANDVLVSMLEEALGTMADVIADLQELGTQTHRGSATEDGPSHAGVTSPPSGSSQGGSSSADAFVVGNSPASSADAEFERRVRSAEALARRRRPRLRQTGLR